MKKQIAIVAPSISNVGGAERTAAMLANSLDEYGYNVNVCVMSKKQPGFKLNENINYYNIDSEIKASNEINRTLERLKWLYTFLSTNRIELVIGYTIQGGLFCSILTKFYPFKCIVCERQDPNQFSRFARKLRNFNYRFASAGIFQTREAQQYFADIVPKSIVIPNFLDLQNMPDVVPFRKRNKTIITAGRLVKAKDHKMLIDAFKRISKKHTEYKLQIWGEGPMRAELQKYIDINDLALKVELPGRTDRIFEKMRCARLFVLSSKYEGYPNALLEAMALGLPAISTDCPCGGPRDIISPGENGQLVSVGDSKELAREIDRLLEDEEMLQRYSQNALIRRSTNDKEVLIPKWIDFIEKLRND